MPPAKKPPAKSVEPVSGGIQFFLSAYDPSDLPSASIDPLGFDRAYTQLAELVLPGLTNVANVPRYFALLCAGATLVDLEPGEADAHIKGRRREVILRLERLWTMAVALAAEETNDSTPGLRGISYVQRELERIRGLGEKIATCDYPLLSRQAAYGVLGIYAATSDAMGLIDRTRFSVSPDLGDRLGDSFLTASSIPRVIRDAATDGGKVSLATLREWGRRATPQVKTSPGEAQVFRAALTGDDRRRTTVETMLGLTDASSLDETELMTRAATACRTEHPWLARALDVINAFEAVFLTTSFGFERLLALCRLHGAEHVSSGDCSADAGLAQTVERIAAETDALQRSVDILVASPGSAGAGMYDALRDIVDFAHRVAAARSPAHVAEELQRRHAQVQRRKVDGGRPKAPWIDVKDSGFMLTLARASTPRDVQSPDELVGHGYRTRSALNLARAAHLS